MKVKVTTAITCRTGHSNTAQQSKWMRDNIYWKIVLLVLSNWLIKCPRCVILKKCMFKQHFKTQVAEQESFSHAGAGTDPLRWIPFTGDHHAVPWQTPTRRGMRGHSSVRTAGTLPGKWAPSSSSQSKPRALASVQREMEGWRVRSWVLEDGPQCCLLLVCLWCHRLRHGDCTRAGTRYAHISSPSWYFPGQVRMCAWKTQRAAWFF